MKITIASGKGGTGKTTISTNLTAYLTSLGRNVVLADLDVEEPNGALFLNTTVIKKIIANKMIPHWDSKDCILCGECEDNCNFNAILHLPKEIRVFPALCHSCYACSELCPTNSLPMIESKIGKISHFECNDSTKENKTFDFVEGRLDLGQEMAVPLIAQTIEYINNNYPNHIKLLDAPPGTSCPVIEASRFSNFVILITESTPFGLNDLKLAVETMKVLDQKYGVIINRYGIGDNMVEEYCKDEDIPIITKIQNDKEIAKLYSKGELIYEKIEHFKDSLDEIVAFIDNLSKDLKCER